jgi:hypothetical protein
MWKASVAKTWRGVRVFKTYAVYFADPFRGASGTIRLEAGIHALHVEQYQQERNKEVRVATVNRELMLLKHMFNLAKR